MDAAVRELLDRLPRKNGGADGSPGALRTLKLRAEKDAKLRTLFENATTPSPLRPELTRALVEAWSMTSLKRHSGRPEVGPWLRGFVRDEPQTTVVWRTHLPVRTHGKAVTNREIEELFEAAPPHASEMLDTETYRVFRWLANRHKNLREALSARPDESEDGHVAPLDDENVVAIALTSSGDVLRVFRMADLSVAERLCDLAGATLVVDARIGGLRNGLLNDTEATLPRTVDDGSPWAADDTTSNRAPSMVRFRVRTADVGGETAPEEPWRIRHKFIAKLSSDDEPMRWIIVEKWLHDGATEEDRSTGRKQKLDEHQLWTESRARILAKRHDLNSVYTRMLTATARRHDEGKRERRWRLAFGVRGKVPYAKTERPADLALLDGYRHEFGSLLFAIKEKRFQALPEDLRDLALHLTVTHHGFGHPTISTRGYEGAPTSALKEHAQEVALRFIRLQKQWGPWGLAWWEALLRAADQQASRENDEKAKVKGKP